MKTCFSNTIRLHLKQRYGFYIWPTNQNQRSQKNTIPNPKIKKIVKPMVTLKDDVAEVEQQIEDLKQKVNEKFDEHAKRSYTTHAHTTHAGATVF